MPKCHWIFCRSTNSTFVILSSSWFFQISSLCISWWLIFIKNLFFLCLIATKTKLHLWCENMLKGVSRWNSTRWMLLRIFYKLLFLPEYFYIFSCIREKFAQNKTTILQNSECCLGECGGFTGSVCTKFKETTMKDVTEGVPSDTNQTVNLSNWIIGIILW